MVNSEASTATAKHLNSRRQTQEQCYITYNMHSEKFEGQRVFNRDYEQSISEQQ